MTIKKNVQIDITLVHLAKLVILFFLVKSFLAYFITYPFNPDTYFLIKSSKSFFESGTFIINDFPSSLYPPLYPIVISISYIFKDYTHIYFSMQIINAFLTSIVIIPAFLISRNFMDERNSLIISSIIAFLPLNFFFPITFILSENLFNVLFLFMVYFLYRSITEESLKWQIMAGFLLGLCFLTRYITFSIIPAVILALLIREICYSNRIEILMIAKNFIKSIVTILPFFITAFITFLPWLIRNGLIFGFTTTGIMGTYSSEISAMEKSVFMGFPFFSRLFFEIFAHVGALVYACGIIFFVMSLYLIQNITKGNHHDKNLHDFVILSFSMILMFILLSSYHNGLKIGSIPYIRIMPRYIEVALPLMFIIGYIGLLKYQEKNSNHTSPKLMYNFFASLIFMMFLIPVQAIYNLSLSTLALLHRLDFLDSLFSTNISFFISPHVPLIKLFLFTLMIFVWVVFYKNGCLKIKYVISIIILMLLVTNTVGLIGSTVIHKSVFSTEIGAWYHTHALDDNTKIVLFDERDMNIFYLPDGNGLYKIGFWINAPIIIGNVTSQSENVGYIVSSYRMNLPVAATEKTNTVFYNGTIIPEKTIYLYRQNN